MRGRSLAPCCAKGLSAFRRRFWTSARWRSVCSVITARTSWPSARASSTACAGTCSISVRSLRPASHHGTWTDRARWSAPRGGCERSNVPARVRVAAELVRRVRELTRRVDELERELAALVRIHRPVLLAETGCRPMTAAILIGHTAGAERFPSDGHFARLASVAPVPVSSGRRHRHRLHRGGDRQLNKALHIIAITRARLDPETRA